MKLIICSMILNVICIEGYAQREYKHDISAGYGIFTSNQIFDLASDLLEEVALPSGNSTSGERYYGGFSINYRNSITKNINAGITFSFDKVTKNVISQNIKIGDINRDYYTVAAEADWKYFKRDIFQMYSLLGLGYTFINDRYMPLEGEDIHKGASGYINFQISVLGIRLGKDLAFYSELGIGYKGILSMGFSYQF